MAKKKKHKTRDLSKLLSLKGEIDLRTKSEPTKKLKYTRKQKHKDRHG